MECGGIESVAFGLEEEPFHYGVAADESGLFRLATLNTAQAVGKADGVEWRKQKLVHIPFCRFVGFWQADAVIVSFRHGDDGVGYVAGGGEGVVIGCCFLVTRIGIMLCGGDECVL